MRERHPVSVSAAVFISDDRGRVLLVQQAAKEKGSKWGPVAGGMEAHEDPMMAAEREGLEEIGTRIRLTSLLGVYPVDRGDLKAGIGFVFYGQISDGRVSIRREEIMDWDYFSKIEVMEMLEKGEIYKPEYNRLAFLDFFAGVSYPLEVIRQIER